MNPLRTTPHNPLVTLKTGVEQSGWLLPQHALVSLTWGRIRGEMVQLLGEKQDYRRLTSSRRTVELLGGDSHCESRVSHSRIQHNVSTQAQIQISRYGISYTLTTCSSLTTNRQQTETSSLTSFSSWSVMVFSISHVIRWRAKCEA